MRAEATGLSPFRLPGTASPWTWSILPRPCWPKPREALSQLDARTVKAYMFDVNMTCYSAEELSGLLRQTGLVVENDYGIRCIGDYWGDNEQKSDPVIHDQLERLELALSGRHPYKLL